MVTIEIEANKQLQPTLGLQTMASILTEADKADIRGFVKRKYPKQDIRRLSEIHIGAYRVLYRTLGDDWCEKNISPTLEKDAGFMKRALETEDERLKHVDRIIFLAEYVNRLRGVENFGDKLSDLRTKNLEATFYELRVAVSLLDGNRLVRFVAPSGVKGADYDLIACLDEKRINVELKCNVDEPEFEKSKIRNPLRKGARQLPDSGPGALFLMLRGDWIQLPQFRDHGDNVAAEILRNNSRVNAIFYTWETWSGGPPYKREIRFHCTENQAPRCPVTGICSLMSVSGHPADPGEYVTYI